MTIMIRDMPLLWCLQVRRIQHQDNYYDCGLYTLTYMEFFAYNTPKEIRPGPGGKNSPELLMKWHEEVNRNDAFLTKKWFNQPNGSSLRVTLMIELLGLMVAKAEKDNRQEELEVQMQQAHWYMQQFMKDSTRFVQLLLAPALYECMNTSSLKHVSIS
jgi:Ulp1 protease family, C-terminal catalytic domain